MKHPVHPMIVHFPIVGWTVTFFGDVYQYFYGFKYSDIIQIVVTASCILAVIAIAAGLFDYMRQKPTKTVISAFEKHMYWALSAFVVFSIRALMPQLASVETLQLACLISSGLGFIILFYAAKLGGELVYRHGMGRDIGAAQSGSATNNDKSS
ncbi:MAG: DUF2231 domain-containing protein [Proteobacteria bacterium]|nr:MAG: DUF2231 domain-containing protein [Pseudomonadota bacterium]